ncbi:MAG: SUMF1/EgtB/PvdO family nonheme iron enzyme, partial [Aquificales bacterium]|nr:SUMF1/EgtB/PvdO family nonheme iron enzyme [Aquificales bacterium]
EVDLEGFWIGRYPVTNVQYAQFIQSGNHSPPSHWPNDQPPADLLAHPVVNISSIDALSYCRWLSQVTNHTCRLPTEAEWEKAARGTTLNRYVWGSEWNPDWCNTEESGRGRTTAVETFTEHNRSPHGVVDMLGNVWEWTDSPYGAFAKSSYKTTTNLQQVVRGGCYDYPQKAARISNRGRYLPGVRKLYLGFRVAADPNYTPKTTALRQILDTRFKENELHLFISDLGIDYENLPALGKVYKAQELIGYIIRRKLIRTLLEVGKQQRPDIDWRQLFNIEPFPSPSTEKQQLQDSEDSK